MHAAAFARAINFHECILQFGQSDPWFGHGCERSNLHANLLTRRRHLLATLLMVRLSSRRSLAEKTAFDAILLVILASVLSRAINGSATFFASIGASFVLVFLHRFFAWIAGRSHTFGKLIKVVRW